MQSSADNLWTSVLPSTKWVLRIKLKQSLSSKGLRGWNHLTGPRQLLFLTKIKSTGCEASHFTGCKLVAPRMFTPLPCCRCSAFCLWPRTVHAPTNFPLCVCLQHLLSHGSAQVSAMCLSSPPGPHFTLLAIGLSAGPGSVQMY